MSWLNHQPGLRDNDWNLLEFQSQPNEAFVVSINATPRQSDEKDECDVGRVSSPQIHRELITGQAEASRWLEQLFATPQHPGVSTDRTRDDSSTINLILASQMSSLDQLPFAQKAYSDIVSQMKMHGSIVRAINRNTHCTFSALPFNWSSGDSTIPSVVYNCRTAGSWEGDMALSVTFFPATMTTNAVWYGFDMKEHDKYGYTLTNTDIIASRLTNFDGNCLHPLMLPTMFAEFERERHVSMVRKYSTQLVQRIHDLAYPSVPPSGNSEVEPSELSAETEPGNHSLNQKLKTLLSHFQAAFCPEELATPAHIPSALNSASEKRCAEKQEEQEPAVVLWQNTSFLSNGLQNWQTQLRKMLQQVQELEDPNYKRETAEHSSQAALNLNRLHEVGIRIKNKIQDLIDEYDEHIRQCNHITEGLRLATQLELNEIGHKDARTNQEIARVNLKVARMTRLDGSLMKSIATLGMLFLPATFVSTFFSMDFFQWAKEDSKEQGLISSYFWVYIVVAVGLTVLTMSLFYTCVLRSPLVEVDEESACG